jgi:hypothetical protein
VGVPILLSKIKLNPVDDVKAVMSASQIGSGSMDHAVLRHHLLYRQKISSPSPFIALKNEAPKKVVEVRNNSRFYFKDEPANWEFDGSNDDENKKEVKIPTLMSISVHSVIWL